VGVALFYKDGGDMESKLSKIEEDYTDVDVKEAENVIASGERKFEYKTFGNVFVRHPNVKEKREISLVYAQEYNRLIQETNLPSYREMERRLAEKNIWTEKDDKELDKIKESYLGKLTTLHQIKLNKNLSDKEKKNISKLEKEIADLEYSWIEKSLYKLSLFEQTLEKKADEYSNLYQIYLCTQKEDSSKLWDSFDVLMEQTQTKEFEKLASDCVSFWGGLENPLSEKYQALIFGNSDTK
jgi:hypothetical protein